MSDTSMKRCSKCQQMFPCTPEYFHRCKKNKDNLSYMCKQCAKAYMVKWDEEHPNRRREIGSAWYKEHSREVAERAAKWKKGNPEKVRQCGIRERQKYPDRSREYNAKQRKEHPEHYKAVRNTITHRRRARKRNLPDEFTAQDWQRCLEYWRGCCAVCGRPAGLWHTIAADHWIPIISPDCPGTVPTNMLPLCHQKDGCNNSKGSKLPGQWLTEKYGEKKAREIIERVEAYFDWVRSQD